MTPVPPYVPAIVVASHVPVVTVPTLVRLGRDVTAVVARVPVVGIVTFDAANAVSVMPYAPDVASVDPLAIVRLPVEVATVNPLIEVAVAAPSVGVTITGLVASTTLPVPVVVVLDAAVNCPWAFTVNAPIV